MGAKNEPVISGFEEVAKNLEDLEKKILNKFTRKALKTGLKPVLNAALERVPVRTGALLSSLRIRAGKRKKSKGKRGALTYTVGSTSQVYYSKIVEFRYGFLKEAFKEQSQAAIEDFKADFRQSMDTRKEASE